MTFAKAIRRGVGANRRSPIIERFWAKVTPDGSCWRWTAHRSASGYGMFGQDRRVFYAHRWSYEHFVGPIPEGLHIDHLCNNAWCVKPDHLEPVTQAENNQRAWSRRRGVTYS